MGDEQRPKLGPLWSTQAGAPGFQVTVQPRGDSMVRKDSYNVNSLMQKLQNSHRDSIKVEAAAEKLSERVLSLADQLTFGCVTSREVAVAVLDGLADMPDAWWDDVDRLRLIGCLLREV